MMARVRSLTSFSADSTLMQWSVEVDVGEAGDGARLHHRETGGDEGVAGDDDFVARPDAQGAHGHVQGRRSGGHADGVLAALPGGVLLLELHAFAAGPVVDLSGAQDCLDGLDGLLVKLRPADQLVGDCLRAAVNCQCFHAYGSSLELDGMIP